MRPLTSYSSAHDPNIDDAEAFQVFHESEFPDMLENAMKLICDALADENSDQVFIGGEIVSAADLWESGDLVDNKQFNTAMFRIATGVASDRDRNIAEAIITGAIERMVTPYIEKALDSRWDRMSSHEKRDYR